MYAKIERISTFEPCLSWNPRYQPLVHRFENSPLSDRDCSSKTTPARVGAALLFNANYYLVRVRFVEFPRKPLERVSVTCQAREMWSHAFSALKVLFRTLLCKKFPFSVNITTFLVPTLASVVSLEQSRSLSGEFSNLWTSGWYLGFQESDLANLRLEKSDSLGVVVKFRHYCERGFESMIVGCHCR